MTNEIDGTQVWTEIYESRFRVHQRVQSLSETNAEILTKFQAAARTLHSIGPIPDDNEQARRNYEEAFGQYSRAQDALQEVQDETTANEKLADSQRTTINFLEWEFAQLIRDKPPSELVLKLIGERDARMPETWDQVRGEIELDQILVGGTNPGEAYNLTDRNDWQRHNLLVFLQNASMVTIAKTAISDDPYSTAQLFGWGNLVAIVGLPPAIDDNIDAVIRGDVDCPWYQQAVGLALPKVEQGLKQLEIYLGGQARDLTTPP